MWAGKNQQILQLEVPMDNVIPVKPLQPAEDLPTHPGDEGFGNVQLVRIPDLRPQVSEICQFHINMDVALGLIHLWIILHACPRLVGQKRTLLTIIRPHEIWG